MAVGEIKHLQVGVNVALASVFTIAAFGSYHLFQENHGKVDLVAETPFGNGEVIIDGHNSQVPKALSGYFGANEQINILVSPSDTRMLFENGQFSKLSSEFQGVEDDYLFQTENGEIFGFDPTSGMIYGSDTVNAISGKKPLSQMSAISSTIANINGLPERLAGIEHSNEAKKSLNPQEIADVKKYKASNSVKSTNVKDAFKEKSFQKPEVIGEEKVSEEELKEIIESNFKTNSQGSAPDQPSPVPKVTTDQKIADINKLREELKARIQKDFGYIPNAQKEIEAHLGGSSAGPRPSNSAASEAVKVSPNQVNVQAIRETRTAVFYKDQRIPKAGFDMNGDPVSEEQKKAQVKGIMDRIVQMDDYWSVVYRAKGEEKKKIAVFSDPTCPYCKKLHENVPELQEAGVTVYHLFYNRSMAPNTVGDPKVVRINDALESAWCSENPNEAINSLYDGYSIPPASCESTEGKIEFPGNEHYLMGRIIDMSGTPYTITEDGDIIAGFDVKGAPQPRSFLKAIGL